MSHGYKKYSVGNIVNKCNTLYGDITRLIVVIILKYGIHYVVYQEVIIKCGGSIYFKNKLTEKEVKCVITRERGGSGRTG